MQTLITTTGTSITGGKIRLEAGMKPEEYRRQIVLRVEELRGKDARLFLDSVSAETKSLRALNAEPGDEVFLLHTDTDEGLICAGIVSDVLRRDMNIPSTLKRIAGLQVQDATVFRRKGIDNLFQVLNALTTGAEYQPARTVVLNITGGFKAVVPYVTLFGQLRRFDVVYIFEQSSSLIRLPPLPVQYDFARVGQALEAIRRLRAEGVMKKDDFWALIPGIDFHDRRWYECLLDEDDGDVTLSAIADHLLGTRDEERMSVTLHSRARAALERAAGSVSEAQFLFMLERVRDPLWRDSKRHVFKGTDLEVYKPGSTPQRLAGFTQGRTFHACELYAGHDEYERDLGQRQRGQYKPVDFAPWDKPADAEIPETDEELAAQQQKRLADAEARALRANAKAREGEELWAAAQAELEALKVTSRARDHEQDKALALVADQVMSLKQQLDVARQPWWQRLFRRRVTGTRPCPGPAS